MAKIVIENRRSSQATIEKRHGTGATIIDLTSRGEQPWVRFSPFYPHGSIPVPFSNGVLASSVEGIWQALKVFENSDIDTEKLSISNMKGIKRSVRSFGKVLGHRKGIDGKELLSYLEARKLIYLPSYLWVLENCLQKELDLIRALASKIPLVFLDYETNTDPMNLAKPLSHAGLVKAYLEDEWPNL